MFAFLLLIVLKILSINANDKCSNNFAPPKYNLFEKCYRSKLGIVAYANYTSLTSCQRLGIEKRGLAINWHPPEEDSVQYSCEILKCAEAEGGLSLENDTRFDYYSLYGKPLPDINSTCVPGIGMFFLHTKKQNYTESGRVCKNMSGVLSDVTTEYRTEALAQLLAGVSVDAAFVGLRRRNSSAFSGVNGDSLDCTTYRAWAPGHPRRHFNKFDCVVITRRHTWYSTSCKKRYPALCELLPGGPYRRKSIFTYRKRHEQPGLTAPRQYRDFPGIPEPGIPERNTTLSEEEMEKLQKKAPLNNNNYYKE